MSPGNRLDMLKKSPASPIIFYLVLFMLMVKVLFSRTADTTSVFPMPRGWSPQGELQIYTADNLYEYIDGAAELYLTYDFQELQVAEYHNSQKASVIMEIYRFDTADQAFGIYSQEKPGDWDYLSIGAQGYQEGPILNFISQKYYVKISGTDMPDSAVGVITTFARQTAQNIGGTPRLPPELQCFPATGMRPHSEKFINLNFLGYPLLHTAFTADYGRPDSAYTLFIIKGRDKIDCAQMVQELQKKSTGPASTNLEGDYVFNNPHLGILRMTWRGSHIWGILGVPDTIIGKQQQVMLGNNLQSLLTNSAVAQRLTMNITFPVNGDTIETSRIRLAAWISDTNATVTLNTKMLPVYPSGAFVSLLELAPGWNRFLLAGRLDSMLVSDTLQLFRIPPLPALPEQPTAFGRQYLLPADDMIFFGADQLTVQFLGSPGGSARFEIDNLIDDPLPMVELNSEESSGMRGLYRGIYRIRPGDRCEKEPVIFYLRGRDKKQKKLKSERLVTVDQSGQPYLVETGDESNLVYYQPDGEIFLDLPRGIRFELIADYGRWLKVKIGSTRSGFIRAAAVKKIGYGSVIPQARCTGFNSRLAGDWLTLTFNISHQVPFQLRQSSIPQSVELTFYDTNMQDEWSLLPENDFLISPDSSFLKNFEWLQTADGALQFRFFLNTRQQWGFRGWYDEKNFNLLIRRPPVINPDNPFKNLIIALDAGHGGEQSGAIGATGYTEKAANLKYANFLAQMLEEAGAKVFLTRTADTTMTLKARADIARQNNAHLLVWLHNNSTSASRDPLAARGASTYYTQQQGQSFAQFVYPQLLRLGLAPAGRVHRSYYMTRQSDMIVFLVEGAFLSHPEDEIFLMDENNLKSLAGAVFQGMRNFLITLDK
jgi:N-acetylmuramoyl-L-alanine amidase